MAKVLVLGDTLSALAVVRSLGRKDVFVVVGVEDTKAPVLFSRYAKKVVKLLSFAAEPEKWKELVKDVILKEHPDLVIPASESSFVPLCLSREYFSGIAKLAIPDKSGFERTFFKDQTVSLAKELGVPLPASFVVHNEKNLEDFFCNFKLKPPFVAKPVVSKAWQDGYKLEFSAKRIDTADGAREYARNYLPFASILIQERFDGVGVGQELLCKNGEILMAFQHLRLREPEGSGGSSFRKSVPLGERMLECSKKLLSALKWTGVVMVEYRKNLATGDFVLLEINGRFWGSLPLAVEAGADFPYALYKLLVLGERVNIRSYKNDIYVRDLFDDLRFIAKSRGVFSALFGLVLFEVRFILGLEKRDAFTWSDPLPGLAEFWFILRSVASLVTSRLFKTISVAFYRNPKIEDTKKLLEKNRSILFVCLGNVSRSPFAAAYLKKKLAEKNISGAKVDSAGLSLKEGRKATPYAKTAAAEYGVDLSNHSSSFLNKEDVESYGLILCMDFSNYRDIKRKFPAAGEKLFLLDGFNESCREIKDPQGGDPETYRRSLRLVKDGVDKLFNAKLIS